MAILGTINGTAKYNGSETSLYAFWADWTRNSYSIENNTSNITISLKVQRVKSTNYGAYNLDKYPTVSLSVNGSSVTPKINYIDTRNAVVCTFATWTGNVSHNSDGSLNCPIVASFTHYGSTTLDSGSLSGNASLDTIPRASSLSLSTYSVNVGGSITANITRASSSFTHAVEFYINSTYYQKYTSVGTSQAFTIPVNWYNAMPSSSSCTAYCRITTYNGSTQIGSSVTKSFTVNASNANAVAGTVSLTPTSILGKTILVKGKNTIKVTASSFGVSSGSSLSSYRFDVLYGSSIIATTTTTSTSVTFGPFHYSGTLTFKVTITDTRGKIASSQNTYTCYDYYLPSFSAFNAYRANSSGSPDVNGTYLRCTYTQSYASVNNTNTVTVVADYSGNKVNCSNGSVLINLNGDITTTYTVYLTITDSYGGSSRTSAITIFGQSRILNITSDGMGVAVGKMSEKTDSHTNGLFECAFDAKFYKDITFTEPDLVRTSLGAAPAGFVSGGFSVTELGQIGSGLLNYYSSMSNLTIKNIYIEVDANGLELSGGRWMATIYRQHGSLAVVKALDLINDYERQTIITNGVVGEWEWVNPPMALGVEYRTTERYMGKPVYAKCVNYGYITAGEHSIAHGIESIDEVVGLEMINRTYGIFTSYFNASADRTNVSLNTPWSMGGFVYIMKYTKL